MDYIHPDLVASYVKSVEHLLEEVHRRHLSTSSRKVAAQTRFLRSLVHSLEEGGKSREHYLPLLHMEGSMREDVLEKELEKLPRAQFDQLVERVRRNRAHQPTQRTYIVAATYAQFKDITERLGFSPNDVVFVSDDYVLMGLASAQIFIHSYPHDEEKAERIRQRIQMMPRA